MPADVAPWLLGCPRYAPAASGIRSAPRIPATGQNGSSRHVSASSDTRSEGKMGTEQRTLNPRVRGSRTWRSTRTDLGHYRPRSFLRARFVRIFRPCLLAGRMFGAGTACQPLADWSSPAIGAPPDLVTQRDSGRQESRSQAVSQLEAPHGHETRPGQQPAGCVLPHIGCSSVPVKCRRHLSRSIAGPPKVHARYIRALTC